MIVISSRFYYTLLIIITTMVTRDLATQFNWAPSIIIILTLGAFVSSAVGLILAIKDPTMKLPY